MPQSYKIFINRVILHITDPTSADLKNAGKKHIFYGKNNIRSALEACNGLSKGTVYLAGSPDLLLSDLKKHFHEVNAAGGIVTNHSGQILLILRNNIWDLPKGKIEKGEDPETAAVREVTEECSINTPKVIRFFNTTYHTYQYKETRILKTTYWYHMHSENAGKAIPQLDEGITEINWAGPEELLPYLQNTYENIKLLLEEFIKEQNRIQ